MAVIKLKHPVEVGGSRVEALDLRRPKARDLLAAEKAAKSQAEREVALFANLAEVSREVIEELDLLDYYEVQKVYEGFLS